MADYDLLIIGAGISGLSVAHYAVQAGLNALVLEQNHRVGGCLHSHRFTGAFAGFWLELGAHSCFNSYGNLLAILESARALDRLQARAKVQFRLFADGTVRTIPSQLSISELLQAPFRLIGWQKSGRSVAEYFGRIVGPRNYAAVFGPAFDAVICQPAGLFPADCLFRSRRRHKNIPRGFTFSDGLQTVADVLATQPGIRIERGRAAREIRRVGEEFVVRTDQCDYSARHLCVATPVEIAARLLRAELPALADRLAEIRTAAVETVGVALPTAQLSLPPLAGLIGRNEAFYSAVTRDTVPNSAYRGFTFHFRPGLLDEEKRITRIAEVLGISHGSLGAENVVSKLNQLPALRVGHDGLIRAVDDLLAKSRLALTGNYFTGVAIEDCVTRSRAEFARLRSEGL